MEMDAIKTTIEEFRKVLNIENVVGKAIETEDKMIIPVTRMGLVFAAGMAEGKGRPNMGGSGSGAGGGAGIEPLAMLVVFKGQPGSEGVKVMSLKNPDPLTRAIGEVRSAVVDVMRGRRKMRETPEEEKTPKTKKQ